MAALLYHPYTALTKGRRLVRQIPHFIHGKSLQLADRLHPVSSPATGEVVAEVNMADEATVNQAVASAQSAFSSWSATPTPKRAGLLFQLRELIKKHRKELALLITQEHGKTLNDAGASIDRGLEVLSYATGITDHLMGQYASGIATGTDNYAIRQPLGVCVGITPFNFPAMIGLWMFPLAIACGNTFILKPSEKDPSAMLRLAELAVEAGIPDGVVNVVHGDGETVNHLLQHKDIKAVSFVGSSAVARQIYQTGIAAGKRVQAFGGAKNHCIILPDADIDRTAETLVGAAYGSAGERCMALPVAVLTGGDTFADELAASIAERVKALRIGPGDADNIDMGPLISREHREKVFAYIDAGIKEGAALTVDGRTLHADKKGFFMGGCLFDHVTPEMTVWREEIFGPVLCLMRSPDFATSLQWINQHGYGNGSAIFTRNPALARRFVEEVQTGMVGVNIPIPVPIASLSFGGWKQSRIGDIHLFGPEGVQFYTQLKTIMQRWPDEPTAGGFLLPTH